MSYGLLNIIRLLLAAPAIMLATTAHEATRALISALLGDETPRREGRLTLNPFRHFEPIGFLLMFATGLPYGAQFGLSAEILSANVGVGWGDPAGTNSRRYKNRRAGVILTAVWPSLVNFIIAVFCANALKYASLFPALVSDFLLISVHFNVSIIVCNLLPVVPFDCLKLVMEFSSKKSYFAISQSESVMQLIMMLLLLSGLLAMVLKPVYRVVLAMVGMLVF